MYTLTFIQGDKKANKQHALSNIFKFLAVVFESIKKVVDIEMKLKY